MKVFEAIKNRRSIRKFKNKEISEDCIRKILEAARMAPSAYNAQPWEFIVVKSKGAKQKLKENNIFKQPFAYEAPAIILCCGNPNAFPEERFDGIFSSDSEIGGQIGAVRDLSIASQNLVLAAWELDIGTCYIGLLNREKIKEVFQIPKNYVIPYAIIMGFPAENPPATPQKKVRKNSQNYLNKSS